MTRIILALPLLLAASAAVGADRPNILLVMVDDMGWSDLGCYGGDVRTPHIDSLAAGGLRFTQFYNTGRCCPTRASLLTGLYPHRAGVGQMTFDTGKPGYRGFLTPNTVTIAEVLREAGYRTAMVGKWHLSLTETGPNHMKYLNNQAILETFSDPKTYPVGRGFEEHYGVIWGVVNFFDPFSLVHNTEPIRSVSDDYHITDALTDHAVKYIEKYSQGDEPFFLYLAHTAPHWPLHALPEDIARYEDTYKPGWQAIREARYRRQIELGLIDPQTTPLSERHPNEPDWADNPHKDWDARAMAVHAAMIDRVDQGIGGIIQTLKDRNLYENTLILFLSDNGASSEVPGRPGFDRTSQTREGREMIYYGGRSPKDVLPGPEHTYAGIGPHWANVANTPLRYWKATQHEGGIRTPLIAHWPKGLKVRQGAITHEPGHVIDIMATCLDLAGAEYPREYDGREITHTDGKSLVPILRGDDRHGHEAIFWEHYGARAVREENWKLVALRDAPWELYDLARDQSETNDLADEHPETVRELAAKWEAWARDADVFPRPGEPPR